MPKSRRSSSKLSLYGRSYRCRSSISKGENRVAASIKEASNHHKSKTCSMDDSFGDMVSFVYHFVHRLLYSISNMVRYVNH